ncbi:MULTISPECIES: HNH endonuclease [Ruegeria]|uniref:HNH endonuclease n=1 Tax=Ruegeria TaxID=97050 RepID=UPI001C2BA4FD|nr:MULTISPECIES: HNH endonuclease [Ruegeria]
MTDLEEMLSALLDDHRDALLWFDRHKGQTIPWSVIQAQAEYGPRLVAQAKGIYKPRYTDYSLSARTLQEGPYPDKEVEHRSDGSWVVQYYQENPDPKLVEKEATNRGLLKCMSDGVPIGFLVKRKPKPGVTYDVLGLGMVSDWKDGYFTIEGLADDGSVRTGNEANDAALTRAKYATSDETETPEFDASNDQDLREKIVSTVAKRRGQARFRAKMLSAYSGKCAISGCDLSEVLEAAHIRPFRGDHSNHPQNGLLLRADLHTLFDLGHIAITDDFQVVMSKQAEEADTYKPFSGKAIALPNNRNLWPSELALAEHRKWAGL